MRLSEISPSPPRGTKRTRSDTKLSYAKSLVLNAADMKRSRGENLLAIGVASDPMPNLQHELVIAELELQVRN